MLRCAALWGPTGGHAAAPRSTNGHVPACSHWPPDASRPFLFVACVSTCLQTGEWQLPLRPDKLDAMRAVMAANASGLDESLLASCYSWMRKASEDKLDGESAAAFYSFAAAVATPGCC